MNTITLPEYLVRIEQLIDDNQFSEAISHCRYILEKYPSHIDVYRLLAKTMLEQHEYDGASDLFQRVLSVDPNDFVSHVGLSVIRDEDAQHEDALWHLERAFEIQPYNATIQDELRRHYARYSDLAVDRIPLTSGALARLFIRGELYQQAVQELRQTVRREHDRVDLEVLLAEALWRNEQRIDAEEVCLNVLQKLPNCIVANAILSEIWLQTGRIGESQKYLRRLVDLTSIDKAHLDKDTAVGRAFRSDGAPPLPDKIELEFKRDMDGTAVPVVAAAAAIATSKSPSSDWMSEVTFDSDMSEKFEYGREGDVAPESPSGLHSYDWMADVNDSLDGDGEELPIESEWFMDAVPAISDDDDWLADIGRTEGATAVADNFDSLFDEGESIESSATADSEEDDWFLAQSDAELQPEESFASENVPEWLSDLVSEPDVSAVGDGILEPMDSSNWVEESREEGAALSSAEEFPDWLSTLVDEQAASKGDTPGAESAFDQPAMGATRESDWLINDNAEDAWDSGEYQAEAMPDWLQDVSGFDAPKEPAKELAAKPPVGQTKAESATAVADDEMPDWLFKQTGELDESLAIAQGTVGQDDWFEDSGSDEPEQGKADKEDPWFTGWLTEASAGDLAKDSVESPATEIPESATKAAGMAALGLTALFASMPDEEQANQPDAVQAEEIDDLWAGMTAAAITPSSVQSDVQDNDDWLSEFSGETWSEEVGEGAGTAVELDDLLQTPSDQLVAIDGPDSDWLTVDDAGWLEDVAEGELEAPVSVAQPPQHPSEELTANEGDEIPDWLLGSEPAELDLGKTEVVVMGDNGDKNGQAGAEIPEPDMGDDEFGDLEDDWLSGMVDDKSQKDNAFAGADNWLTLSDADDDLADDEAEEGVPDWLSGLAASTSQKEDALPGAGGWLEGDEGDDDFDLTDTEAEAEEGVPDWLMGTAVDKGSKEDAPAALDSWMDMADEDDDVNLMHETEEEDDLTGLFGDSSVMADWLSDEPETAMAAVDDEDDFPAFDFEADDMDEAVAAGIPEAAAKGVGLMAWLSALPEEDETELDEALDAVSSEPSLVESMPDIPSEELFATDAENFPDWLPAGLGPVSDLAEEETNLPDWLLDSAEEKRDVVPARLESDDLFDLEAEETVDEWDDNPQWEEKESLTAAGLTALFSSIDDEPARIADMSMDAEMSWLTDMGEGESDLESVEESELDWMDDEVDTTVVPVPKVEIVDIGADAVEDEMDDAISWLEELAYQQETPVEDLPTVAKDLLGDNLDLPESADMDIFVVDEMATAVNNTDHTDNDELWDDDLDFLDMPEPAADMAEVDEMATAVVSMTAVDLDAELVTDNDDGGSWLDAFMDDEELTEDATLSAPPEGDDEAAMAWLEGLAAKHGAPLEELPSLQGRGEDDLDFLVDEAQSDLDDAVAWMDNLAAEPEEEWPEVDEALFAAAFGAGAAGGAAFIDAEELSAEEDDELADALNFLEDQVKAEGVVPVVSGGKATLSEAELNDALDWLEDEATIAVDTISETATPEELAVADSVDVWVEDDEAWDVENWEDEAAWVEPEPIDVSLDLTDETASPLITRSEEGDFDVFDMPDDPEEAMIWLDRVAHEDSESESAAGLPIVPLAAAVYAATEDDDNWNTAVAEDDDLFALNDLLDEDTVGAESDLIDDLGMFSSDVKFADMPEDPDEAMAWLEMFGGDGEIDVDMEPPPITPSADAKFVVEDVRPVTAVVAAVPEPEIEAEEEIEREFEPDTAEFADTAVVEFDVLDIPEDPDEAMAWLEMFGGDGMIDVDMEPPPITPSADAKFVVEDVRPVTAVVAAVPEPEIEAEEEIEREFEPDTAEFADTAELDVFDIPEDPDEAMAWLEMFGGDGMIDVDMEPPPITPSADAKFVVEDTGPAIPVAKATVPTMADEDPFASEGGFTSGMPEDPDEAMAWLDKMADEQNALLEGALPPDESPLPSWMQMAADDRALTDDLELAEPDSFAVENEGLGLIDDITDDLSDSLPDWFSVDPHESTLTGQTGWLRSIEDIDVNSWLSAEAEVSGTDFDDDQIVPDVGHGRTSKLPASDRLPQLTPLAADMPAESYEVSPVSASELLPGETLQTSDVRSALAEMRYTEAATHYQQLIASGTATLGLIAELETLADEYPQQPAFRRLLGDAYMRNGQLQKALNTYRVALDQL